MLNFPLSLNTLYLENPLIPCTFFHQDISECYEILLIIKRLEKKNELNEKKFFKLMKKPKVPVILCDILIHEVYYNYYVNSSNKNLMKWIKYNKKLENSCTTFLTTFYSNLINNFSEKSYLRLYPDTSTTQYENTIIKFYIFMIVYSNRYQISPISSIFYNIQGEVHKNLEEVINSKYVPGSSPNRKLYYLRYMLNEFQHIEKNKICKCSDTCYYIYFIGGGIDCGFPTSLSKCPICNSEIGGKDFVLFERKGHCYLSEEETRIFLYKAISKTEKVQEKGFQVTKNYNATEDVYNSTICPLAYNLMNLIIKTNLFFIIELHGTHLPNSSNLIKFNSFEFTDAEIANIKKESYRRFLHFSIEKDFEKISQILFEIGIRDRLNWFSKIFNSFTQFLLSNKYECENIEDRELFEGNFENFIKNIKSSESSEVGNKSKLFYKDLNKEYMNCENLEFKNCPIPTNENIIENFYGIFDENIILKKYKLIHTVFNLRQKLKSIICLDFLTKIIKFLFKEFDYILTRNQARIPIKLALKNEENQNNFDQFQKTLKEAIGNDPNQYEEFNILLNENSDLAYFLSEKNNNGSYTYNLILCLSKLHNEILDLMSAQSKLNQEHKSIPLFEICSNEFFDLSFFDFTLHSYLYVDNSKYLFDYYQFQQDLSSSLITKKKIDLCSIPLFVYQSEVFLNFHTQLFKIGINQRCLCEQKITVKKLLLTFLNRIKSKFLQKTGLIIKEIYDSANYILINFAKLCLDPNLNLSEFLISLPRKKISKFIYDKDYFFASLTVKDLISLHRLIEKKYFIWFFRSNLPEQYKNNDQNEIILKIINIVQNNIGIYPSIRCIKGFIVRLAIRITIENDISIEFLSNYALISELWEESVTELQKKNFKELISPKNFEYDPELCLKISSFYHFYKLISRTKIHEKNPNK